MFLEDVSIQPLSDTLSFCNLYVKSFDNRCILKALRSYKVKDIIYFLPRMDIVCGSTTQTLDLGGPQTYGDRIRARLLGLGPSLVTVEESKFGTVFNVDTRA